ncbi:hypothetical protein BDQ17DRAFT_1333448 [Cyathus striatus]|nr:hypothetical protein BDQ17DRAFT_1333448 [Cyathus striatus]
MALIFFLGISFALNARAVKPTSCIPTSCDTINLHQPLHTSSANISSGYISANSSNELQQQWTYEVGEISGPVWFYCQQTDPVNSSTVAPSSSTAFSTLTSVSGTSKKDIRLKIGIILVVPRQEAAISREKGANLGVRKLGVVEESIISNDANVSWVDVREILQELDTLRRELAEVRDSMASDPLHAEAGESVTDDTPPPTYYRASENGGDSG